MAEVNILHISEYIIRKRPGKKISMIKLQVATYLIQEAYVKEKEKPLFRESFIKKDNFPECAMLRGIECEMPGSVSLADVKEFTRSLPAGTREIIDRVMENIDRKTTRELKDIITADVAWNKTEKGKPITVKRMSEAKHHEGNQKVGFERSTK